MSTFYFMKYDEVVGKADDLKELTEEIRRLKTENPESVLYHNREGHIKMWLVSEGYQDRASKLRDDMTIEEIIDTLETNHEDRHREGGTGRSQGRGQGMKGHGTGPHGGGGNRGKGNHASPRQRTMQR